MDRRSAVTLRPVLGGLAPGVTLTTRSTVPPALIDEGVASPFAEGGMEPGLMINTWLLEVPPPGAGLKTVINAVVAEAVSVG